MIYKVLRKTVSLLLIYLIFLIQNTYAGFFDQLSDGLQKSLGGNSSSAHLNSEASAKVETKKAIVSTGLVKKAVNVRSGPGTTHAKVGRLTPESSIRIINTQANWLQIEADTSTGFVKGWVYKPLVTIGAEKVAVPVSSAKTNRLLNTKARQNVYYAGYSKEFQKIKQMMVSGDLKGVDQFYTDREAPFLKKNQSKWQAMEEIGLLRWMERGTLYLDEGDLDKSIRSFTNAEDILNVRQQDS
ncbi:MAG: SH3 domain-containing protein, partial [Thiotrichaceae bacterium]|nr:SH3 domain-containing protein [Thiotrichaceae bacterium]